MNPVIRLVEAPVVSLTAGAYVLVLVAALLASWYALGRNLLYLERHWRQNWVALPPFYYTVRSIGTLLVVAVDLLLIAGIVHIVT